MGFSIDEYYGVPEHQLLPRALLLIAIAFVCAVLWDRKHPTMRRPASFKRRLDSALTAGLCAPMVIGTVMGLAVDMPAMPLVETRVGALWEIGDFLVVGFSVGVFAGLSVGLVSALAISALVSLAPRLWTAARGVVAGLALSIPGTVVVIQSLFWCGNVTIAQRVLGVTLFTAACVFSGMAAGGFASGAYDGGTGADRGAS